MSFLFYDFCLNLTTFFSLVIFFTILKKVFGFPWSQGYLFCQYYQYLVLSTVYKYEAWLFPNGLWKVTHFLVTVWQRGRFFFFLLFYWNIWNMLLVYIQIQRHLVLQVKFPNLCFYQIEFLRVLRILSSMNKNFFNIISCKFFTSFGWKIPRPMYNWFFSTDAALIIQIKI